ncbi:SH3 domain-containing protein [Muricoccus pecuniae]|uniref:SH3b domain-containing protein n=1 Tax=Muricoccus pecuniae TaxID=693023 RepID=A0A840YEY6_9PROT|nr:SH3 domain-containing protein [Roseomonas pecuniae]MBB5692443.1 hypothetical protein [Roseomonas pecuniae]
MRKGLLLLGLLALGGCWEDTPAKGQAGSGNDVMSKARAAAEERIRGLARDRENLRFRAVETYRQAVADTYAVCGQATLAGDTIFIPFVSVVTASGNDLAVEQYVARNNVEATRVYVELVGRCFEGGGPQMRANGTPVAGLTPPLPNGLPLLNEVTPEPPKVLDPTSPSAASVPPGSGSMMPAGTLAMRQNGNIRSSPTGGGTVLRVAPNGAVLKVFGTAPGGWFQVGEAGPEGWVHRSMTTPPSGAIASAQ